VWGLSAAEDGSTWFEKNVTIKGAPQRQLRRVLKDVQDRGDSEFGLRAFVLVEEEKKQSDSENIFDDIEDNDDEDE